MLNDHERESRRDPGAQPDGDKRVQPYSRVASFVTTRSRETSNRGHRCGKADDPIPFRLPEDPIESEADNDQLGDHAQACNQ